MLSFIIAFYQTLGAKKTHNNPLLYIHNQRQNQQQPIKLKIRSNDSQTCKA